MGAGEIKFDLSFYPPFDSCARLPKENLLLHISCTYTLFIKSLVILYCNHLSLCILLSKRPSQTIDYVNHRAGVSFSFSLFIISYILYYFFELRLKNQLERYKNYIN